jgi:cell division protein FtsB
MTRPPSRRRRAADAAGLPAPVPRRVRIAGARLRRPGGRTITARSLVLGVTIVFLVVILASPVARYVASRGALNSAAQQLSSDQRDLDTVRAQLKQWGEPAYVEQQARQRLQYAMPGETVYIVLRPGEQNPLSATSGPGTHPQHPDLTWNQKLWTSVQAAAKQ